MGPGFRRDRHAMTEKCDRLARYTALLKQRGDAVGNAIV
jgi:hypothetical protein